MVKNNKLHRIISVFLVFILLLSTLLTTACRKDPVENPDDNPQAKEPMPDPVNDNYRTFYQIFVGSFSDGNGDGIGDLQGIINRMDYLNDGDLNSGNDLGVQGLWLSPIFSSPTYHKYDARDYYSIDWRFGTETTLKKLIDLCHERNVKIILDLVINHTSDQHPWFKEFISARMTGDTENKYYDYYTCVTAAEKVGGRSYQKIAGIDGYYEVNFSGGMPELDYDNPEVKEEMLNVAKYYLDLGVDGFRFDAVKYIYYGDTTSNVDFWNWYMGELTEYKPEIYCVGECWSGEGEILEYYPAMNCFNFAMSGAEGQAAKAAKGSSLTSFINYIESYQDKVQKANPDGMPIQFLSNHDQDRIAGAFILPNNMKMAANLYLLTPGSHFIYYGEEIGIRGSRGSEATDANRRLGMLWGDGEIVRNPEGTTYKPSNQITTTVASQQEDESSILRHYQQLLSIRHRYPAIARGDYNAVTTKNSSVGGFYVEYQGEILGIIHNTSNAEVTVDLSTCKSLDGHSFSQICEILGASATLNGTSLTIGAQTTIILK